MCGQRGLLADSDDQTFGMALSRQFRTHYDTIIAPIQAEVYTSTTQNTNFSRQRVFWKREEERNVGGGEGGRERVIMEIERGSVKERERNMKREGGKDRHALFGICVCMMR